MASPRDVNCRTSVKFLSWCPQNHRWITAEDTFNAAVQYHSGDQKALRPAEDE
jgi:hypothetical protein